MLVGRRQVIVRLAFLFIGLPVDLLRHAVLSGLGFARGRQFVDVVALLLGGDQAHALVAPAAAAFDEVVQLVQFRQQGIERLGIGDHGIGGALVDDVVVQRVAHMLVLDVEQFALE